MKKGLDIFSIIPDKNSDTNVRKLQERKLLAQLTIRAVKNIEGLACEVVSLCYWECPGRGWQTVHLEHYSMMWVVSWPREDVVSVPQDCSLRTETISHPSSYRSPST